MFYMDKQFYVNLHHYFILFYIVKYLAGVAGFKELILTAESVEH